MDDFGRLPRVLRRFAVFAVAFSIVSITTGIFLNYSYGITQMGPAAVWLWPVATVGQLLVVLVLAELAGHVPLAGANYQWAARLVDARFGYLVGALGVLYGAVGLPGIALLGLAPLTATVFGLDAEDARLLVFLAVLALVIAYLINIVRVQLAARVNNVAVFAEIIGTVVLSIIVFVAWVQRRHTGRARPRLPFHGLHRRAARVRARRRRADRRLHARRLRGRGRHGRGGRRRPPHRAAHDDPLAGGVRRAGDDRAGRVHRGDPRPRPDPRIAGAARRDRRVLAGPGAHPGVPRHRRVLDVRADRGGGRGQLAADLRHGARRHAAVLRVAAADQPAHGHPGARAAGLAAGVPGAPGLRHARRRRVRRARRGHRAGALPGLPAHARRLPGPPPRDRRVDRRRVHARRRGDADRGGGDGVARGGGRRADPARRRSAPPTTSCWAPSSCSASGTSRCCAAASPTARRG